MFTRTILLLITIGGTVACAHRRPDTREARRAPVVVESRRPSTVESRADWRRLGQQRVDGTHDRDVIAVGSREGAFRQLMIVVEDSAVELEDVVVNFTDGSHFSPQTRLVFGPNSRSGMIDLPGNKRAIRNVAFRYGNLPGGGRAQVELWAK
jgi:hypothetical protein